MSAPPDRLRMSQAVMAASRVLPAAIAADVAMLPKVVTLARNAPTAIAGHTRAPCNKRAAGASPLGGHTGLALGCRDASVRPALARAKYAVAKSRAFKQILARLKV